MIRTAWLAVALAITLVGCWDGKPRQEGEAHAESTGPFPDGSELYDHLLARIAEVGSGHVEARLEFRSWEITSDFATGSGTDFVETTIVGPEIRAKLLRLGGDLYVQNADHPSRPTAWLAVSETDDVDTHPLLVESINDIMSSSTPAFGIDQLHEAELELATTGPLLAVYEGTVDVWSIGALGIDGALADAPSLVQPVVEITIYVNKDGLPEQMRMKLDFDTGQREYSYTFAFEYSQWGEPKQAPERPVDLFDSAEEFASRSADWPLDGRLGSAYSIRKTASARPVEPAQRPAPLLLERLRPQVV